MIISAGIAMLCIWLLLALVSCGIPVEICERICSLLPQKLQPALIKMQNGFFYDLPNEQLPAEVFFFLYSLAFLIYFFVLRFLEKKKDNKIFTIVLFAVLFKAVLIPSILIHENDIYRYIWDGKVTLAGINPYKYAPQESSIMPDDPEKKHEFMKLKTLRNEDYTSFNRIGHKEVPTIYPPAAQALFSLSNLFRRGSIPFMKFLFVLFDILVIVVIYRLLLYLNMNPNMVVIYAWSPLVLKEFANSGHYDSVPIFLLVLSLLFLFRKKISFSRIAILLGILFKFFPVVIIPVLAKRLKAKSLFIIGAVVSAAYLPFFLWGKMHPLQVFRGLITYGKVWSINGAIFECFYSLLTPLKAILPFGPVIFVKIILASIYIGILAFLARRPGITNIAILKKVFWAIAWLFLLSPVGDPWYFCWLIPFLCFFPYKSFIVLSWLLIFNYLSFSRTLGDFSLGNFSFSYLILLQYLPFYILLIKEIFFDRRKERLSVS